MQLDHLITYPGCHGPVLLIVLDGVGLAPAGPANALSIARTPIIDNLLSSELSTRLHAHGVHVGLPGNDDMGNSEVGHNTLGGGRIFDQGAKLVNNAIRSASLFAGECWKTVVERSRCGGTVHFLGLLSDGNVHSHIDHLADLLRKCREERIAEVRVHVLLDGRDVAPRSALRYVRQLEELLAEINREHGFNYCIASGGGRMAITMDRYAADWSMVHRGYFAHCHGSTELGASAVSSVQGEIQRQYDASPDLTDQYLEAFVVVDQSENPVGAMRDGDAVILFNFRGDRAIEISQAFENAEFEHFDRGRHPDVFYCGMLQYDGDLKVPGHYLVDSPQIDRVMGEFLCGQGMKTFAVSETQKFGHVTYFWNGNRSGYIDESLETYVEIPSDNIEFNRAPQMKAAEITDATIALLESGDYRFGRINFANGDMVGHTGDIPATVRGLETVDHCIGRLQTCIEKLGGVLILTADHGNADEMFVEKDGERLARTSHSLNPVPFVIADTDRHRPYILHEEVDGGLANVAATVFNLLGLRAPEDYRPSLISFPKEPNRKSIYKGMVVNLGIEAIRLPDQSRMVQEVIRHPGGAVIVAVNADQEICVIRQFRHAAGGWIWEFPAGIADTNESPLSAAKRELKEETGITASAWMALGATVTSPGFCDERLHLFLARDIVALEENAPEPHEFIEVHWLPMGQVARMILDDDIQDAKTIAAFYRAENALGYRDITENPPPPR